MKFDTFNNNTFYVMCSLFVVDAFCRAGLQFTVSSHDILYTDKGSDGAWCLLLDQYSMSKG
jgi:ABC-type cobalamin transport system ATPase subunit